MRSVSVPPPCAGRGGPSTSCPSVGTRACKHGVPTPACPGVWERARPSPSITHWGSRSSGCWGDRGQGTASRSVGRKAWPRGSRGKAAGMGARRKEERVAQAREQVKMHPQLLGGAPRRAGSAAQGAHGTGCSRHPRVGGPSPRRWGAQLHGGSGCSHESGAPRPRAPCGSGGGRRSTPGAPMGAWVVPAASPGHPSVTGLCPAERWVSGSAPGETWGAPAQGCELGCAPGYVPGTPHSGQGLEQPGAGQDAWVPPKTGMGGG